MTATPSYIGFVIELRYAAGVRVLASLHHCEPKAMAMELQIRSLI